MSASAGGGGRSTSVWLFHNLQTTNTMQYITMHYNKIQDITIQYNALQYNTMHYNTIQGITIQYNALKYNTRHYNTIQCITIQCNASQYNTMHRNTIQLFKIQHNIPNTNTDFIIVVSDMKSFKVTRNYYNESSTEKQLKEK